MNIKEKALASSIHFTASLLVFSVFIFVLLTQWYPSPYFTASGGWQGLKIVVLVDLVLGPLLTFIIFNKEKSRRELTIDLSLIIALQLAALMWGVVTVYQQRPLSVVFWDDRFFTVPARALSEHYVDEERYQNLLSQQEIPFLFARKPETMDDYLRMMKMIKEQNIPPHHQIGRYQPFAPEFESIKHLSVDIDEIISQNQTMKLELDAILKATASTVDDNVYLPLESKYHNIVLVFNAFGENLGYLKAPDKSDP